jgi:hypothetical protein
MAEQKTWAPAREEQRSCSNLQISQGHMADVLIVIYTISQKIRKILAYRTRMDKTCLDIWKKLNYWHDVAANQATTGYIRLQASLIHIFFLNHLQALYQLISLLVINS